MRRSLAAAAVALPFVAGTLWTAPAHAQVEDSFTERAVVSCLSGATVSGITSGLVLMPLANSGPAAPVVVSAIAVSAGVGCGFGLAFTTAATAYSWAWRSMVAPAPSHRSPPPGPADKRELIHAAW